MRDALSALLSLQEIDHQIFRLQGELQRLPRERAQRRAEIDRRIQQQAQARQEAQTRRVRIKEIEDQTTVARQRIRKLESEAAASRQDMALLVAFQHEIRTLKREIATQEETGLALLEEVERHDAEAQSLQAEVAAEEALFAELSANVEREIGVARARLADLESARRERLSASIPAEGRALYERLLQAREGQALALVEGRQCQACFMEMPTNLVVRVTRGTELVQCPSCDRILYQA